MPASERNTQPTVVRLGDLSSIVVAVSHMLGFEPTESLVAVALSGPRERMAFTLRLDLPPAGLRSDVVAEVTGRMAHAGADAVMLFVYTADVPTPGGLPHA